MPEPPQAPRSAPGASCNVAEFIYNKDLEKDGGPAFLGAGTRHGAGTSRPGGTVRMLRSLGPLPHSTDTLLVSLTAPWPVPKGWDSPDLFV